MASQGDCALHFYGSMPILSLQNVRKEYSTDGQPVRALDGVSLDVEAGQFVALVGRSGCGKSTLLNLAGAMDFPTSGSVLLDGVATSSLKDAELTKLRREKVGFIFQSFQLLHTLTVLGNVELPLLLAGRTNARDAARERLRWVELEELGERYPHQLSGGQMQRVGIARALIHGPKLLLADEPTGNLDSTTGNVILELLQRLSREQNTATVMATHSAEAAALADVVVRFARRKNRERGASLVARLLLFYRLMVRPLLAEPVRTSLTVLAIALGVAVVLAIDLAGFAAAGSFRSSMETLAGNNDFEIVAAGGVPEDVVGKLAQLPYSLRISARIEDYAAIDGNRTVPLLGLDLVCRRAESFRSCLGFPARKSSGCSEISRRRRKCLGRAEPRIPLRRSDSALLINDRHARLHCAREFFPDDGGNAAAIVMDLAAAQRALGRVGHVDRILVKVPEKDDGGSSHVASSAEWAAANSRASKLPAALRAGIPARRRRRFCPKALSCVAAGTGTDENRKMLAAFRWNLKLLSYIALVVGAFLIYNTISVSVVRRRAEIGIVRALGASRATVLDRVHRRSGESRTHWRADRITAGPRDGERRGQADVGDGRSAVRQQPARDDRAQSPILFRSH